MLNSKRTRAICTALILAFILTLCSCASNADEPTPSGSFSAKEVPLPRMYYYVPRSQGGENDGLYYIPLSEDEAELCRNAFSKSESSSVAPENCVYLFKVELDCENEFIAYDTLSGGYFFSRGGWADDATEALLDKISEASGYDAHISLSDFKAACEVELIKDGASLWTTDEEAVISGIGALLDAYIGSGPSNFDNYDYELKCTFADGSEHTLLLSSDDGFIFVPPLRYYKLPKLSPLRQDGWLDIFGTETWPG